MHKRIIIFCLCLASFFSSFGVSANETESIPKEKTILFSEDFSNGLKQWNSGKNHDFYVLNEKLNIDSTKSPNAVSNLICKGFERDGAEIEFDLKLNDGNYAAALLRYNDDNTYYSVRFYKTGKVLLLKRINGGKSEIIAESKCTKISDGAKICISLIDTSISVKADGEDVINTVDVSISTGAFGFEADKVSASIDNLEIYQYSGVDYETKQEQIALKETQKIYVSLNGSDSGDGTKEKPYASFEKAKKAAKKIVASGYPVDVVFREGTYYLSESVTFDGTYSGTATAPIRYMAEEGEKVVFSGGTKIDTSLAQPVSADIKEKLYPNIADKIVEIDLKKAGIDTAAFDFRRKDIDSLNRKPIGVTLNGDMQKIARWPNAGYKRIESFEPGGDSYTGTKEAGGTIYYDGKEILRWTKAKDLFVEGYLCYEWSSEWALVKNVDIVKNALNMQYRTKYGIAQNGKWAVVNLLEEIDVPGEWYIDFDAGKMYYYPPHILTENDELVISTMNRDIISILDANYITIEGIHLTMSRDEPSVAEFALGWGNGIGIRGNNVTVKDCILTDIGMNGVWADGRNITVDGCIMNNLGSNGVFIPIGDMAEKNQLQHCNIVIQNCDISNTSMHISPNSNGAVRIERENVGVTIRNNVFHNVAYASVHYHGLEHHITLNEVYNASNQASDSGGIYSGRSFDDYGCKIDYNLFHHIGQKVNAGVYPASAVFWDDFESGQEFSHNISYLGNMPKTSALKIGGGRDNVVVGNTMVASPTDIIAQDRSTAGSTGRDWNDWLAKIWNTTYGATGKIMSVYPAMSNLRDEVLEKQTFELPNTITDNLTVDCEEATEITGTFRDYAKEYARNTFIKDDYSIFVDPENYDYRVTKKAKKKYNISDEILDEDFDINSIGIQTRTELDESFKNFEQLYPADGSENVTTDRTVLAWSQSRLADEYTYVVATDPELKDVVASGTVIDTAVDLENIEAGKTYYWTVTAHNLSRQFRYDEETEVRSFKAVTIESVDKSRLEEVIKRSKQKVNELKEGENPGEYKIGSVKEIKELTRKHSALLQKSKATQTEIDKAVEDVASRLNNLDQYLNVGYATLDLSSAKKWIPYTNGAEIEINNGIFKTETTGTNQFMLDKTLPNYNIMCFRTKINELNGWIAYGLRALNATKYLYAQPSYYFLVKNDIFELQKNGAVYATAENNGKFKQGEWNDVEFGAVNIGSGLNLYLKLNGEVIFDYFDKNAPQNTPGMFAVLPSVSAGNTMTVELAASDIPTSLFEVSDRIIAESNGEEFVEYEFDTTSGGYSETGNWQAEELFVRSSSEHGASAEWHMNAGKVGNDKVYRVYYYHIPSADGDKNVNIKLYGDAGTYETAADLSSGEEGWAELGTFKFRDPDYVGRLAVSFTGSGNGKLSVGKVKIEPAFDAENMLTGVID